MIRRTPLRSVSWTCALLIIGGCHASRPQSFHTSRVVAEPALPRSATVETLELPDEAEVSAIATAEPRLRSPSGLPPVGRAPNREPTPSSLSSDEWPDDQLVQINGRSSRMSGALPQPRSSQARRAERRQRRVERRQRRAWARADIHPRYDRRYGDIPFDELNGAWGFDGRLPQTIGTERFEPIDETPFVAVTDDPLSTFSIDVDTASYAHVRRYLAAGRLPPPDAVRIEELINYFRYDYPAPKHHPFSVTYEVSACPWNPDHWLAHVGLQGQQVDTREIPPRNLVFLIDVSGSMADPDKLPLLQQGLLMLTQQLGPEDRVSIVVYAGASGVVLRPTSNRRTIERALMGLYAGGSTNGGAGIELAYRMAEQAWVRDGINRVILATDGDFNVGMVSDAELLDLIESKRERGIHLSVLGFGNGNINDATMEMLADYGDGNYAFVDSTREAHKVLVEDLAGTLQTIAKDVKIQVEFNPREVAEYRLIGYENRKLAHTDFNDDRKDAGEIGAGHTVTALYEIVPTQRRSYGSLDPLRYQDDREMTPHASSGELMNVKIRYKHPDGGPSQRLEFPIMADDRPLSKTSDDFRFSAAVAEFGLLLRGSQYRGQASYFDIFELASEATRRGADHRQDFLRLVEAARQLDRRR